MQYRELEAVLAKLIGVYPDRRPRFQARLKQLQRMGFPEGVNAGRSARAEYRADQLFKLAFVLELLQIGITPERAISFVQTWWDKIRRGLLLAGNTDQLVGIAFWPKDFGGFTHGEDEADEKIAWTSNGSALVSTRPEDSSDLIDTATAMATEPRSVILNISRIWAEIVVNGDLPDEDVATLLSDIELWKTDADIYGRPLFNVDP